MVSGASRGLGQAIAVAFVEPLLTQTTTTTQKLDAVLLARSSLQGTNQAMQQAAKSLDQQSNLEIYPYSVDLGDLSTLEATVEPILDRHRRPIPDTTNENDGDYSRAILINCAGTTGEIGRLPTSLHQIQTAVDLNFTSKAWLTSRFLQHFSDHHHHDANTTVVVVNISSMCAVKPTPTMALYCATSAARDMFHTVVAADHEPSSARILNYAPGSCDTGMQSWLREHDQLDTGVRAYCESLVTDGGLVDCAVTARALVRKVLEPEGFVSGDRVEFVDSSSYKY